MLEGLETTDEELDDTEEIGQNYFVNSLPPAVMDEYYPLIRPIPTDNAFSKCYNFTSKKDKNIYYPSSSSSSPTEPASPPQEVPEPPRKGRKITKNASLLMSDTYAYQADPSPTGEEDWLADSGASYHTTFE